MLLSSTKQLDEHLVEVMAMQDSWTAAGLQEELAQVFRPVTKQAVYQELRKLIRAGVVVKNGTHFHLRADWILKLIYFSDTLHQRYLAPTNLRVLIPQDSSKKLTLNFGNLRSLAQFWSHFLLVVIEQSDAREIYEGMHHVWFHLVNLETEHRFLETLKLIGTRYHLIVQGTTALDHSYEPMTGSGQFLASYGHWPFPKGTSDYFSVVGDYFISVRMPKALTERIEQVFNVDVKDAMSQIPAAVRLLEQPGRIVLSAQCAPAKSETLRKKFQRHFA